MVATTLLCGAYYWLHDALAQFPRALLRWAAQGSLAFLITPIIFIIQLRAMNMKMSFIDTEGRYEWV